VERRRVVNEDGKDVNVSVIEDDCACAFSSCFSSSTTMSDSDRP